MNLFALKLLSALFLAAFLGGCGGCQRGSVPESDDAPARKPATAAAGGGAAAATPTRAAAAAIPTVRNLPALKPEKTPAGAGGGMEKPQAAPGEEPAAAEEPEEADCSVIADADPDYGDPPLTVHFSVEYECTEGSATVRWDFGDHTGAATDDNPVHTYREAGEYTAVVTVTTADGATATDEIDITAESEEESPPDVEPGNP